MKLTTPASIAPGSLSAGMIRPLMASTVFHCAGVSTSGPSDAAAAARARGRGTLIAAHSAPLYSALCSRKSRRLRVSLMIGSRSDVLALRLGDEVVGDAERVGEDGERRVVAARGREAAAVHDPQVRDVVGAA